MEVGREEGGERRLGSRTRAAFRASVIPADSQHRIYIAGRTVRQLTVIKREGSTRSRNMAVFGSGVVEPCFPSRGVNAAWLRCPLN